METVSMLINVGNRQLNLKVPAADQENILKAEKLLNDKIAALRKSYAVNDNQDILAMCAFSIAGELISQQASGKKSENTRMEKLESLDALLNGFLAQPELFNKY
ncbi:MAG: cell division protein ZapA [Bacteroidetes bacterium]|jgi:cell division protein ZapA|nr:cell division protein ZapA [Bacteroidota bacterium]HMR45484.1 cell division protein ZapA [Bacteroidia bacterium]HMU18657.1 cell division protein ZapA [Bacteroidia bacterium]HMY64610.1 cell division protein ZapA [Bacteroidia bacterium]HNB34353.1 cell division protein ZapA [Bacteroidia bacterium]